MPTILVHRHGSLRAVQVSARRYRNYKQRCECEGLWFPHRIRSRASEDFFRRHGTLGCRHAPAPNVVFAEDGRIMFTEDVPF